MTHSYRSDIHEALGGPRGLDDPDLALLYGLDMTLNDGRLERLRGLVDPVHPGADLQGEPGWRIQRQLEIGEPQKRAQQLLARFPRGGHVIKDPGPTAGRDPTWPAGARFKVELYEPDEFGNPKYALRYYDAATFEGFLKKLLPVYAKHHPESAVDVEQIMKHAAYWVEHDAERST